MMPLALLAVPAVAFLLAVGLFLLIRWWVGKTGAAILFTLSLLLNIAILTPLMLGLVLALEVKDLQDKMPTAPKLLLVEKGPEILLAARFTDVSAEEGELPPFQPLGQDQVSRLERLGQARYDSLTREYYKVFVLKTEFLEDLAPAGGGPSLAKAPGQSQAILGLLAAGDEAYTKGDMQQLARVAAQMQEFFRQGGMEEALSLARQIEQAARAGDMKAIQALGPRLAQLARPAGGLVASPLPREAILKVMESEDPAKLLAQYLPPQALQGMGSGSPAEVKLMLLAYLMQSRGFDPVFLLKEYQAGHLQVYPATPISTLAKLLPMGLFLETVPTL
jgi:hypothetical protein